MALLDDPLVGMSLAIFCMGISFHSKGYVRRVANAAGMLVLLGMILSSARTGPPGPMGLPGMPGRDCECAKEKQRELIEPPFALPAAMDENTIAKLKGLSEKIQKDYIEKYAQ